MKNENNLDIFFRVLHTLERYELWYGQVWVSDIISVWKEVLAHETLLRFSAPHQQNSFCSLFTLSTCFLMNAKHSIVRVSRELRDVLFTKKKTREREKVLKVTLWKFVFVSKSFRKS